MFPGRAVTEPMGVTGNLDLQRVGSQPTGSLLEAFASPQELAKPCVRLAIKVKDRIVFIRSSEVIAVSAEGNYVRIQFAATSHLLRESISVLAEKLQPYGFIRIHRSALVNTAFVEEIKPYPTGEYGLRVKGGKEFTVTRTYKKNLKALAESWIGTGVIFSTGSE